MKNFIYMEIINFLKKNNITKKNKLIFLGATYKKNVPDLRNSLSLDIYKKFKKIYLAINKLSYHFIIIILFSAKTCRFKGKFYSTHKF